MSTLQAIERAARSLPRDKQEHLLSFLTTIIREGKDSDSKRSSETADKAAFSLHPELQTVTGIIPVDADAEDVHLHRLLKHS